MVTLRSTWYSTRTSVCSECGIGLIPGTRRWPLELAAWTFGLGIIGFSGSLYGLSLTGNASFGLVAPVGGTLMILAWFFLAAGVCPCGTQAPRD